MAQPPRVGFVRLTSADPPLRVVARLWEERPNVESGYGGWEEVERPRRKPLTTWKSQPALRLTLPLLLDRFRSGLSVEREISQLELMAQPSASDGEPPQVRIATTGAALPYQGRTWVVADLAMGDALMNASGNRVRQQVTLTLLEYVEDVYLAQRSAANRRRRKAQRGKRKRGAATKRLVAKRSSKARRAGSLRSGESDDFGSGEDLLTIAARELGDAERWVEIAELNGLRDPRAISPGQVLRLP